LDLREAAQPPVFDIIQIGIDHYGLICNGHPGWPAHGGHGSDRKFPIIFAGALLDDEAMANVKKNFPSAKFGEDEQTAYGDCWTAPGSSSPDIPASQKHHDSYDFDVVNNQRKK
jgi:hypothetical protein